MVSALFLSKEYFMRGRKKMDTIETEIAPKVAHQKKIAVEEAKRKAEKTNVIGFKYRLIKGDKLVKISVTANGNAHSEYVGRVSKSQEAAAIAKTHGLL